MRYTPFAEQGEISMLHDLSVAVGKLAAETGRHIHLVLENDDNRRERCWMPSRIRRMANTARSGTTIIITPGMCC